MTRFAVHIQTNRQVPAILITAFVDGEQVTQKRVEIPDDGKVHVWSVEGGDVTIYEKILE